MKFDISYTSYLTRQQKIEHCSFGSFLIDVWLDPRLSASKEPMGLTVAVKHRFDAGEMFSTVGEIDGEIDTPFTSEQLADTIGCLVKDADDKIHLTIENQRDHHQKMVYELGCEEDLEFGSLEFRDEDPYPIEYRHTATTPFGEFLIHCARDHQPTPVKTPNPTQPADDESTESMYGMETRVYFWPAWETPQEKSAKNKAEKTGNLIFTSEKEHVPMEEVDGKFDDLFEEGKESVQKFLGLKYIHYEEGLGMLKEFVSE